MKQILTTICFVILCVKLAQATNVTTNATNASVPTNSSTNATELTTLYIGAFFDLGIKDGYGSLPMAEQAIGEINNNTDLLSGYRLELVVKSTQGSLGIGQKVFHEFLDTGPRKIMLLGPVEDSLAKSVAAYSGIPDVNLLQFSYGTSDLELASRRDLYPNFFRTTTSVASLDAPRIKFVKEYGWDEVGIIYGDSVQYLKLSNQLAKRLQQNSIKVLAEVRLQANDPRRAIRTLKDKGIHVILGMFPLNSVARKMICEAYRERMYGPHYVWMFLNSFNNKWWIPGQREDSACSDVEMKCQIQNHFSFYHTRVLSPKTRLYTYPNKTGEQIIDEYRARVDNYNDTSNRSNLFLNVYDAVWSIAFVLENSRSGLLRQGKAFENLTYGDANATNLFRATANNLDFATPNVGTRVRYYTNGNRKNAIVLRQIVIKDGKFKTVGAGKFDVDTGAFTASSDIQWFAGTPYTKTSETYTYRTIDRTLFIAWVVFAVLGIIYALFCLLTLVLNFKKKIVKNSGPVISILIILGCILNYITVILYGFDYSRVSADQVTRLCRARSWTFAIGFTLSVGGLVAKLWMAYSVLKERFVRSRNVMMFWMLGILVLLLIIDVIILACWETKDPLYRALKNVRSQPEYECFQPITADTFRADIEVVEHCDCANLTLWLVLILAIKVLILIAGGFLAWQTRRLYIPALNDTQHCVSCMFVVVVFCVIGTIVAFTTTMYPSVYYGVIGALIIIATTLILVLLFTNKIVRLSCKRKRTKTILSGETSEDNSTCACGAACAKLCSFCACSAACCIFCCSCFPCCNLYSCLRSFFCGSQVHPAESGRVESKSEFYIGGVLQDRDAEIVYLKNELREKETMLSNLGPRRTLKSNSTQTVGDGSNYWDHDDYDSMVDGSGSDGESLTSSNGKRRFRRAANNVRIFSEGADYSHVRSKVNTGIAMKNSSLSPNSMQSRRNSRMSISSLSNEDLRKLKTTLAEKDDEITRLQKELEALRLRRIARKSRDSSTSEQEPVETSPKTQRILLIETPATPIPEERTELITFVVQPSVSPSSPSPSKPNVDDMTSSGGLEPKSGKPAPKTKTQDRTNRKSSVGPGGAWLFGDQSESTTEKDKTSKNTGGLDDKSEIFGDVNTTPSTKNSSEDRKASLTNVAVSLPQENDKSAPKNTDNGNVRNEAGETSQDKVSSWLLGNDKKKDPVKNTTHEDEGNGEKMDYKGSKDNDSGTGMSLNHGGSGSDNTKVDEANGKKMDDKGNKEKASVNNNTNTDEANGKKMDDKGNKKKDPVKNTTHEDEGNGKKTDDKGSKKKDSVNNNTNTDDGNGKKMDDKGSKDNHSADSGTEKSLNNAGIGSDNAKVKDELTKDDNIAKDVKGQDDDAECEDDDRRNIEMIHEEDEDNDEEDDYDEEEDEDDGDEGKEGDATDAGGSHNGTKKNRARGRRKKLGYGKLKWNAASKVDTGSSGYAPRKSVKKIPNFKNSYSHVQSRFSTVSEGNTIEKTTEQQPSPPRKRSVTINKTPQADYSNVRPRLYNGATRRYNSEMPSTVPAKGYLSIHKERPVK